MISRTLYKSYLHSVRDLSQNCWACFGACVGLSIGGFIKIIKPSCMILGHAQSSKRGL